MATIDRTTIREFDASNTRMRRFYRITGPASYATGGDPFAPSDARLSRIDLFLPTHPTNGTDLRFVQYDGANNKIKWFLENGAEVSAATNLSTYTFGVEVIGT